MFSMCKKDIDYKYYSGSRIILFDDEILINNIENDIVVFNSDLLNMKLVKTNIKGQLELFKINDELYGMVGFDNLEGQLVKFDRKTDTVVWFSDNLNLCTYPNNYIMFKNENLLYFYIDKYNIDSKTGKLLNTCAIKKIDLIDNINEKINSNVFISPFDIGDDTISIFVSDKSYSLAIGSLTFKENEIHYPKNSSITSFEKGFVINSGEEVLITNNSLSSVDTLSLIDFKHPKLKVINENLIVRDFFYGIVVYNLKDLNKLISVQESNNKVFIDATIIRNNMYVLSRNEVEIYPINN